MKFYKTCYKCNKFLHISFFYSNDNMCKKCHNNIAKIHQQLRILFKNEIADGFCQICNEFYNKLEIASLNGHKYSLNKEHYILLCTKCHFLFDKLKNSRNSKSF